jgi:hypothetical protein
MPEPRNPEKPWHVIVEFPDGRHDVFDYRKAETAAHWFDNTWHRYAGHPDVKVTTDAKCSGFGCVKLAIVPGGVCAEHAKIQAQDILILLFEEGYHGADLPREALIRKALERIVALGLQPKHLKPEEPKT